MKFDPSRGGSNFVLRSMVVDAKKALRILWREAARSSQAEVARAIEVTPQLVSSWKGGGAPKGKRLERLIEWAEKIDAVRPIELAYPPANPSLPVVREAGPLERAPIDPYTAGVLHERARAVRRFLAMAVAETDELMSGFDQWAAIAPREVLDAAIRRDQTVDEGGAPEGRTGTG